MSFLRNKILFTKPKYKSDGSYLQLAMYPDHKKIAFTVLRARCVTPLHEKHGKYYVVLEVDTSQTTHAKFLGTYDKIVEKCIQHLYDPKTDAEIPNLLKEKYRPELFVNKQVVADDQNTQTVIREDHKFSVEMEVHPKCQFVKANGFGSVYTDYPDTLHADAEVDVLIVFTGISVFNHKFSTHHHVMQIKRYYASEIFADQLSMDYSQKPLEYNDELYKEMCAQKFRKIKKNE